MEFTIGNCPVSWGIEEADDPRNTRWEIVLDQVAASGSRLVELGPPGYLPSDAAQLHPALESRGLRISAGFVADYYGTSGVDAIDPDSVRRTCQTVAACEARTLLVMEEMYRERDETSGRSSEAPRLSEAGWTRLIAATNMIAEIATAEFGLTVAFHPHVATYVEFEDEIDRYFRETDPNLIGLCLDTGHSVWAGVDPLAVLSRHGERLRYLHVKDVDGSVLVETRRGRLRFADAVARGLFCPLGQGIVDFNALRQRLQELNFRGHLAIEQDRTPGQLDGALDDAQRSMQFLRNNGFA